MLKIRAPGSCGELVQGTLAGQNFLITCPIDLYTEVEVISDTLLALNHGAKVRSAIEKALHHLGIYNTNDISLKITSDLPQGKGMASSSADISAVCLAISLSNNHMLTLDELADIALSIEPTDGVFYPGIVMFDHINGTIRRSLGNPPAMKIAIFDTGGEVDTLKFNSRSDLTILNSAKERQTNMAIDLVIKGIQTGSAKLIGKGATISALANQSILYKPYLEPLIYIGEKYRSVGVTVAHSGTVMGILYDAAECSGINYCIKAVLTQYPEITYMGIVSLISGGLSKWGDNHQWISCF